MANGARFVVAWFAVWALGAVPAFINCHLRGAALLHCVGVSTARLVLVEEEEELETGKYEGGGEVAAALAKGEFVGEGQARRVVEVVGLGGRLDEVLEREEGWEGIRPDDGGGGERGAKMHDMGILIYTSGTTGLPKPAVVSWGKMRAAGTFVGKWLPLKKGDVLYTVSNSSIPTHLETFNRRHTLLSRPHG